MARDDVDKAIDDSLILDLDGVEMPVVSKATLISTKQTNRPSDRVDCDFLQQQIDDGF